MGFCIGIGMCLENEGEASVGPTCDQPIGEYLYNWTFDCGDDG
jgi:hypothetical protein